MATVSASELNAQFEDLDIPLELIDEPSDAERETMEEEALAELALSIADVGLIKKLIVRRRGERYEVRAGHRRLLACRFVNYSPVPCRVMVNDQVDDLAVMVHENAHTESVNAIEEARFYHRVLTELCHNDVDLLCLKVRRARNFVEDRLILLQGYPSVVEALHQKKISIAVARELNKLKDPNRLMILLDVSVTQGATARQVAQWRRDAESMQPVGLADADPADQLTNDSAIAPTYRPECLFCESAEDPHLMELFYLHKPCKNIVLRMLNRRQNETTDNQG